MRYTDCIMIQFQKIYNWFLSFLELQLFITLCSLPILAWWGIPISAMTLVGNLIFSPILALFIFMSAIIFITEVVNIPNGIFIYMLETITALWLKILGFSDKSWLIGLKTDYLVYTCITIALCIWVVKSSLKREYKVALMALLTITTTTFLHCLPLTQDFVHTIYSGRSKTEIICQNQELFIHDKGNLSKPSNRSFSKHKLMPFIIQKTGSKAIKKLVLVKLNKTNIAAIRYLNELAAIESIETNKNNPILYNKLKAFCQTNNIQLITN